MSVGFSLILIRGLIINLTNECVAYSLALRTALLG